MRLFWLLPLMVVPSVASSSTPIENLKQTSEVKDCVAKSFLLGSDLENRNHERAARLLGLSKLGIHFPLGKVLKEETTTFLPFQPSVEREPWESKVNISMAKPNLIASVFVERLGSQSSPTPKDYSNWKTAQALVDQIRTDTEVPALGLAYWSTTGHDAAVAGVHELGKPEPVMLQDRWLIGSITKALTATMIARLVDRGVMRWTTTIGEVFPKMDIRPEYRSVTLLQLLQHRAGVVQDRYVTSQFLDQAAGSAKTLVEVREHYTQFTLNRDPLGKPGEKMAYSNAGYSIAAHMAEVLAHRSYEQLMQDLVFRPLKMTSVRMGVPGTGDNPGSKGQLNGHVFGEKGLEPHVIDEPKLNAIQEPAGAGVSMSLDDLLKFARYHLEGLRGHVRLMKKATFEVLHTPADPSPGAYHYACGWVIDDHQTKEPFHGHTGSDGTFTAEIALWPNRNLAVVAISNAATNRNPSPPFQAVMAVFNHKSP